MARKSDLASGQNFSPREVDLREVLEFAKLHGGDRKAFEAAIQQRYYDPKTTTAPAQKPKLAYNVANGMEKYGLVAKDATLTPLGEELYRLRTTRRHCTSGSPSTSSSSSVERSCSTASATCGRRVTSST